MSNDEKPHHSSRKKMGKALSSVLLLMVIAGLGGFGLSNFGGGLAKIGSVGSQEITVNDYARELKGQIRQMSKQFGTTLTMTQVQAFGIDRQVLQTLVDRAAQDEATQSAGVSVGDDVVASKVVEISAFQNSAGAFDRTAYRSTLADNNLSEAEFEDGLRREMARQILTGALSGGIAAPSAVVDAVAKWSGERRSYSLLTLGESDLPTPIASPDDSALQAYYDAHIADFTRPEAKRITYVSLIPSEMAKTMPVDEAAIRALYDAKINDYVVPEKRLVERLVYPTDADAQAAKARLDGGESFETLVAERKLTLEDIDLGEQSKEELGEAGAAIFALNEPGVVGPLPSALGPALFRMNGILAAQTTTFEQARDALAEEAGIEAARAAIADRTEAIDDALAGGATLEDLAKEQGMTLATFDFAPSLSDAEPIVAYEAFRAAAEGVAEGDFAETIPLEDGGVAALRLDSVVPAAPIPFADARPDVEKAWHAEALAAALSAHAETLKTAIEGGTSPGALGIVSRGVNLSRNDAIAGAPSAATLRLFELAENGVMVVTGPDFVGVLKVDAITPAEFADPDGQSAREAIETKLRQLIAQDAVNLFVAAKAQAAGIQLDQAAINAVNSQIN